MYSSNNVRKAKKQHLNIVCQNLIARFHEFRAKVLRFYWSISFQISSRDHINHVITLWNGYLLRKIQIKFWREIWIWVLSSYLITYNCTLLIYNYILLIDWFAMRPFLRFHENNSKIFLWKKIYLVKLQCDFIKYSASYRTYIHILCTLFVFCSCYCCTLPIFAIYARLDFRVEMEFACLL